MEIALGNIAEAYGGDLSFKLMSSADNYAPSTPRVRISGETFEGDDSGGMK